jgi:hypothetical protein
MREILKIESNVELSVYLLHFICMKTLNIEPKEALSEKINEILTN